MLAVAVDTDMLPDDWLALIYLASEPGVEIRAVTVDNGAAVGCEAGVAIARDLLASVGERDVPVACGPPAEAGGISFPAEWAGETLSVAASLGCTAEDGDPAGTPTNSGDAVALLDLSPAPGSPIKLATGVMVIYADEQSFTFMTPQGHTLSAWITFSAERDGDVTVAQAQALERPSDPFDEMAYLLGGNRMNNAFWKETVANMARHMGAAEPVVETQIVCIDKRRQWRQVRNLRHSIMLRTARRTLTAPVRWLRRS